LAFSQCTNPKEKSSLFCFVFWKKFKIHSLVLVLHGTMGDYMGQYKK